MRKVIIGLLDALIIVVEMWLLLNFWMDHRKVLETMIPFLAQEVVSQYDNLLNAFVSCAVIAVAQIPNLVILNLIVNNRSRIFFIRAAYTLNLCDRKSLCEKIDRMLAFQWETKVKWGVTQNSEVQKMANTAEGILACASASMIGKVFSDARKNELTKLLESVEEDLSVDGYKSYDVDTHTVHCTSMMLFAIQKQMKLGYYKLKPESEATIYNC